MRALMTSKIFFKVYNAPNRSYGEHKSKEPPDKKQVAETAKKRPKLPSVSIELIKETRDFEEDNPAPKTSPEVSLKKASELLKDFRDLRTVADKAQQSEKLKTAAPVPYNLANELAKKARDLAVFAEKARKSTALRTFTSISLKAEKERAKKSHSFRALSDKQTELVRHAPLQGELVKKSQDFTAIVDKSTNADRTDKFEDSGSDSATAIKQLTNRDDSMSSPTPEQGQNSAVVRAQKLKPLTVPHYPPKTVSVQSTQSACGTSNAKEPQNLLAYPVVPLKDTLARYLRSVKPLLSPKAYQRAKEVTHQFEQHEGRDLQTFLEYERSFEKNWLAQHWIREAHLEFRAPLTVFSSPCMTFPLQSFENKFEFLRFVAKVIYGMGEFKQLIDSQQIHIVRMDEYELDNSQFGMIFGTVRKPKRVCDILEQHAKSDFVIIIHKNNFYKLPIYNAQKQLLDVELLTELLLQIYGQNEKGPPIGMLTHDHRDNWAEGYRMLLRKPHNLKLLQIIEQSLFTVSLDKYVKSPKGEELNVLAAQLLHGGGKELNSSNRWMDKSLQLIVNPNGMAGFCYEQAPADCQPIASMMEFIQQKINNDPHYGCIGRKEENIRFVRLDFSEPDECVSFWLGFAEQNIAYLSQQLQLHIFTYECYGSDLIKNLGLCPDSFIQMALQLAFYRFHKDLPVQCESAHLRLFAGGRTATIRSTSMESRSFVHAMVDEANSHCQRLRALRKAVESHQETTKLALQGRGVDRHLFGLQVMARKYGQPLPKFFDSFGFMKSRNFRINSSNVTTKQDSFAFMACGPMLSNGYGCCYNPRKTDMIFAISAWRCSEETSAKLYGKAIERALNDMYELVLEKEGI